MSEHKLSRVIEGFDLHSYYAGVNFTFAEVVSLGCKRLALSSPYTDEELEALLEPTRMAAGEYGTPIYVERDLLTTRLFDPALTEGRSVILIAQNQGVIDEYLALKELKAKAVEEGRLGEVEEEVAWRLGRLLSYSDEVIERLLARSRG